MKRLHRQERNVAKNRGCKLLYLRCSGQHILPYKVRRNNISTFTSFISYTVNQAVILMSYKLKVKTGCDKSFWNRGRIDPPAVWFSKRSSRNCRVLELKKWPTTAYTSRWRRLYEGKLWIISQFPVHCSIYCICCTIEYHLWVSFMQYICTYVVIYWIYNYSVSEAP